MLSRHYHGLVLLYGSLHTMLSPRKHRVHSVICVSLSSCTPVLSPYMYTLVNLVLSCSQSLHVYYHVHPFKGPM
ncbi:hypothetical protein M6B38_316715 [Iris pallida]|uniref:Uncharacterized protein n=1 Tax=Iris pallida TaxID=29817 RepID=A0AAX6HEG1_IRIPA|nr:hypothetical protein M6B38_316715 [Iris pallida]